MNEPLENDNALAESQLIEADECSECGDVQPASLLTCDSCGATGLCLSCYEDGHEKDEEGTQPCQL